MSAKSIKNEDAYEKQLARFEEIISILENGQATLTESIALFKEGQELSAALQRKLDDFNGEILKLNQGGDGFVKADAKLSGSNEDGLDDLPF